jgi:hypothetical protein
MNKRSSCNKTQYKHLKQILKLTKEQRLKLSIELSEFCLKLRNTLSVKLKNKKVNDEI